MFNFLNCFNNDPSAKLRRELKDIFEKYSSGKGADRKSIKKVSNMITEENDIDIMLTVLYDESFKSPKCVASMIFMLLDWTEPTPEIENRFKTFRVKLTEYFMKLSNNPDKILRLLTYFYQFDMCDEILPLKALTCELIGSELRVEFLNGIKNKVRSIIYSRENIEMALKQGTVSEELLKIYEIIKTECNG